jgi:hypothetical protein
MKEIAAIHSRQNIGGGCWHGVHVDEHGATTVLSPPGNRCSPIQGPADPTFVKIWQELSVKIYPLALNNNIGGGSKHPETTPDGRSGPGPARAEIEGAAERQYVLTGMYI